MKRTILFKSAIAVAVASAFAVFSPVYAQDDVGAAEGDAAVSAPKKVEKVFFPLIRCIRAEGVVQVLKPGSSEWVKAEEDRYYPLGSSFRTAKSAAGDPDAEFAFGPESKLVMKSCAEVATAQMEIGSETREVILKAGKFSLNLPRTLKDGLFSVSAPFFKCSNLAGESTFEYAKQADGDEAVIRVVTGALSLKGRHYNIARMGAANQIRIRTTGDDLFTSLRGESGDYKVTLDQGVITEKDFVAGTSHEKPKTLDFSLSPQCAIKIFRATSAVGGRTVVSMMTFNPAGQMMNRCAFAENRANVNSGELVVATVVSESEKSAKKDKEAAAEDVEEVEATPTEETTNEDAAE